MERIVRYLFICIISIFFSQAAYTDEVSSSQSSFYIPNMAALITPQNISFSSCIKEYSINQEKLYYLTIAAINANRFEVEELQSKTGYVLFKAVNKEFLAAVVKIGVNKSMLKITPTNNNYYFAPGIVQNIFHYIDLNINESVTTLKNI